MLTVFSGGTWAKNLGGGAQEEEEALPGFLIGGTSVTPHSNGPKNSPKANQIFRAEGTKNSTNSRLRRKIFLGVFSQLKLSGYQIVTERWRFRVGFRQKRWMRKTKVDHQRNAGHCRVMS